MATAPSSPKLQQTGCMRGLLGITLVLLYYYCIMVITLLYLLHYYYGHYIIMLWSYTQCGCMMKQGQNVPNMYNSVTS